jgi:hypothetical protein
MTKITNTIPAQSSNLHGVVASLFSVAILVMAGLFTLTAFASV